jgi:hypothetical protein
MEVFCSTCDTRPGNGPDRRSRCRLEPEREVFTRRPNAQPKTFVDAISDFVLVFRQRFLLWFEKGKSFHLDENTMTFESDDEIYPRPMNRKHTS